MASIHSFLGAVSMSGGGGRWFLSRAPDPPPALEQDKGTDSGQQDEDDHDDEPRSRIDARRIETRVEEGENDRCRQEGDRNDREDLHDVVGAMRDLRDVEVEGAVDRYFGGLQRVQ